LPDLKYAGGANMSENNVVWYLSGQDDKPAGPYSADQISEWLRTGQIPPSTLCWRKGMTDWRPLSTIKPFAVELEPAKVTVAKKNENDVAWYIPGQDDQPSGPYSADQISEWLGTGQIPETTLCWREGMPDWLPLTRVEPFAGELKHIKAAAKKKIYRISIAVFFVVCAIAVGVVVYLMIMGPPEVRNAKKLMAAELYTPAAQVLEQYVISNPLNDEAAYLLAIAKINEYAADKSGQFAFFRDSAEVKKILVRVFKADPKWIEKAKKDIASAIEMIPATTPDSLNRNLEISRLRAELNLADKKQLAVELMDKLVAQGDLQSNYNLHQGVVLEILGWDSSLSSQVIALVLGDENVSALQLSWPLATLQRWAGQRPEFAKVLSTELLNRAESSNAAGGNDQAKMLLSKALELNPEAAKSEEHAFLYIRLMNPDDAKLTRCQLFLRDYPDSPHRPDVLITILRDSVAISKQYGRWNRDKAEPYLSAGLSAAKELIRQDPKRSNLDVQVLELSKKMAERKKFKEAIDLTSDLLKAAPDSAIELQITQAIAQWRLQSGVGNLPPELVQLDERVKKELDPKIVTLSTPAAIQVLAAENAAIRVIQIADDCTADKFNSQQVDTLRRWVARGGILWVNNDVLSMLNINHSVGWGGAAECQPAVIPEKCHILTDCSNIVVSKRRPAAYNLNYTNVIPLLTAGEEARKYCYWSLVPYGRGWVSDVKSVDLSKHDGARFWLNFRLFFLGWDIPGAPEGLQIEQRPPSRIEAFEPPEASPSARSIRSPQIVRINDTAELEKLLAVIDSQKVIWISLSRKDIDIRTRTKLRNWVRAGGALWVETDLAGSFGFTELRTAGRISLSGQAEITRVQYPIISDLSGEIVNFELDPNGVAIRGTWLAISQNMSSLLVQPNIRNNIMTVVCAVIYDGDGVVILRPAKIDTTSPAGQAFESRLLSFSLSSKGERQTMVPRAERQRPTIPSRRRR